MYIPDFICGDFDSAKPEVLRFYDSEVSNHDTCAMSQCLASSGQNIKTHAWLYVAVMQSYSCYFAQGSYRYVISDVEMKFSLTCL